LSFRRKPESASVFLFVIPAQAGICFSTHTASLTDAAGAPHLDSEMWASPKATFAGCLSILISY
jgi:hypothetical protein